jgi:hypothetical protein
MNINWQIGLGVILLLSAVVYIYFRYTREGFQTGPSKNESPATCSMMNVILEQTQKKLDSIQNSGNQTDIDLTKKVIESIQNEITKARC